jgi:hypothetical protein
MELPKIKIGKREQYKYPFYRYHIRDKYYILLTPKLNKAEVGIASETVNDFFLWHGFQTVKTFTSTTPRKAYNKAKKWILKEVIK